jgi:hypothetical protein
MKKESGSKDIEQQVAKGYELMLYKPIVPNKLSTLVELYRKALNEYLKDEKLTNEMVGFDKENNKPEDAALVVVANAMLNLDEVLTKN